MDSRPGDARTGFAAIGELLAKRRPTAVMAFNDPVAFGVMLGLRERGLEPGVDCAVTGADNAPEGALWRPALATVAFDAGALGARGGPAPARADRRTGRARAPPAAGRSAGAARVGVATTQARSCRAMISRWIWLVPS